MQEKVRDLEKENAMERTIKIENKRKKKKER